MQQLHLVGMTTDLDGLILSARKGSKSGGFVVQVDDQFLAAVSDAVLRRDGPTPEQTAIAHEIVRSTSPASRVQSTLSPREIQARLRIGRSIEEVAGEAGVDVEWVTRFAVPIMAEQAQVVERAGLLYYTKPRQGESAQPLATSVRWNLAERGVRLAARAIEAGWSAYQIHEALWVVRFRYFSRARLQEAEWELDVRDGTLVARNRLASQLAYVEKSRRGRPPMLDEFDDEAPDTEAPAPARPRVGRAAKPRRARKARKGPARAAGAAAAKTAGASKAAGKRAGATKAVASKKAVTAKQAGAARKVGAAKRGATKKASARTATARKAPAKRSVIAKAAPSLGRRAR